MRTFAEPHFPVKTRTGRPLCAVTTRVAAAVCSRAANVGLCRSDRRHAIAVPAANRPHAAGVAGKPRNAIAPRSTANNDAATRASATAAVRGSGPSQSQSLRAATPLAGEGQRPAEFAEQNVGQPCQRPGCYDGFAPSPRSPHQRFCSCSCRQALRRVRQREATRRQRRRHGVRPRPCRGRPPP